MPLDLNSALQGVDTSPAKAEAVEPNQGPRETGTSSVVRTTAREYGAQLGRNNEAVTAAIAGESLPKAAVRFFAPRDFVEKYYPDLLDQAANVASLNAYGLFKGSKRPRNLSSLITPQPTPAEQKVRDLDATPFSSGNMADIATQSASNAMHLVGMEAPDRPNVGAPPGAVSKNLSGVGGTIGAGMGFPLTLGATPFKYIMSLMGMSEAGEVAGDIGKYSAKAMGASPGTQDAVEAGSKFVGGVATAPLNVIRANTFGEALKAPYYAYKRGSEAYKLAKLQQAAGDKQGILALFADQYGGLRDKTKGVMQTAVNDTIARDIAMNPDAVNNIQDFKTAAAAVGADPTKFNLAQTAGMPGLIASVEPSQVAASNVESKKEILDTAKRVTGDVVKPDAKSVLASLKDFQKAEKFRTESLNIEGQQVADTTPTLAIGEKTKIGRDVKDIVAKNYKTDKAEVDALYAQRNAIATQANNQFDISPAIGAVEKALGQSISKMDPPTVPRSIRNLKLLSEKEGPVSMQDLGDALNLVNADLHDAAVAAKRGDFQGATQARNLTSVEKALTDVLGTQGTPEVIAAHNVAVARFKELILPRYREGANANLRREASVARQGEDLVDDAAVIPSYLVKPRGVGQVSETSMQQFDNAFGGVIPGTKQHPEAYNGLWRTLEDRYATEVLKGGAEKFNPERQSEFLHEYEAALNRVPALRDKLELNAEKLMRLQAEGERIKENFKTITGSELTKTLGVDHAKAVIKSGLLDPRKMGQIISALNKSGVQSAAGPENRAGANALVKEIMARANPTRETENGLEIDGKKLFTLLNAGRTNESGVGGLQVALRAALGRAEGDAQMVRLRALAVLAERQAVTDTRAAQAGAEDLLSNDLVKGVTNQSAASWITGFKTVAEGRASLAYSASVAGSRYLNMKLQAAVSEAKRQALFDPEMADAVLELSKTSVNKPISYSTASKVFNLIGTGAKEYLSGLLEHGMVVKHMTNAARVSITQQANEDKDAPSQRQRFRNEPAINR